MRNYYLIDFENVGSDGLAGVNNLSPEDEVIIFYSTKSNRLTMRAHIQIGTSSAKFEYFEVAVGGKDALDHQISTFIGFLVGSRQGEQYYIVSRDTGYKYIANFWNTRLDHNIVLCIDSIKTAHRRAEQDARSEAARQDTSRSDPTRSAKIDDAVKAELPTEKPAEAVIARESVPALPAPRTDDRHSRPAPEKSEQASADSIQTQKQSPASSESKKTPEPAEQRHVAENTKPSSSHTAMTAKRAPKAEPTHIEARHIEPPVRSEEPVHPSGRPDPTQSAKSEESRHGVLSSRSRKESGPQRIRANQPGPSKLIEDSEPKPSASAASVDQNSNTGLLPESSASVFELQGPESLSEQKTSAADPAVLRAATPAPTPSESNQARFNRPDTQTEAVPATNAQPPEQNEIEQTALPVRNASNFPVDTPAVELTARDKSSEPVQTSQAAKMSDAIRSNRSRSGRSRSGRGQKNQKANPVNAEQFPLETAGNEQTERSAEKPGERPAASTPETAQAQPTAPDSFRRSQLPTERPAKSELSPEQSRPEAVATVQQLDAAVKEKVLVLLAPHEKLQANRIVDMIQSGKKQLLCNSLRRQLGQEQGLALYHEIKKTAWK